MIIIMEIIGFIANQDVKLNPALTHTYCGCSRRSQVRAYMLRTHEIRLDLDKAVFKFDSILIYEKFEYK